MVSRLLPALLGVASLLAASLALASPQSASPDLEIDLETVLQTIPGIETFKFLYRTHLDIYANIQPDSVTILVPNEFAFSKAGGLGSPSLGADDVRAVLQYHILKRPITTLSIFRGNSISVPTYLQDPVHTNVTGGQQVIITKQPDDQLIITSGFATRGTVMRPDSYKFDGGYIQVIDSVLHPPESFESTAMNAYTDLREFVEALARTGVWEFLDTRADVTVFAPTNEAFKRIADYPMDSLKLQQVLRYHIYPDLMVHSWDLRNGISVTNPQGPGINVTRQGNFIFANSARLLQTDVLIANGVVHMIDNVLNPNNRFKRPDPSLSHQDPVFGPEPDSKKSDSGSEGSGSATIYPLPSPTPSESESAAARHGAVGFGVGMGLIAGAMAIVL